MTSSPDIPYYEYIVVGCGGIGSGAVYWLSKRAGKSVLGLEQFKLGHDNGGSQDVSRIIRLMYNGEHYTKIVRSTYDCWHEVEKESGLQLVHKCGSLDLARKNGKGVEELERYADSMAKQNIPFDRLTNKQLMNRFPQFTVPDDFVALFQKDGGLVDAALGNSVHIQLAMANGATVIDNCPVLRIETAQDGSAMVYTTQGQFRCRRVVVTSGAWSNHVLGSVGVHIPLIVSQEQVTYFNTPHMKKFTKEKFPVFIYHPAKGFHDIYALPIHVNSGTKIGIDNGGPPVTPSTRGFVPDKVREDECIDFLKEFIPEFIGPIQYSKTCLYTMTYDRDFVIDTLASRGRPQVVFCIGAGHAYKWASLLGKIVCELAVDGKTQYDIKAFRMDRPAVMDPTFKPVYPVNYPGAKL